MRLPVPSSIAPMLAKAADVLPDGDGWLYEPKWDGFRGIVFRDGHDVVIGSRNEKPLTRYFPEIVEAVLRQLPERCVVDGELVVPGRNGALDFDALSQRIHPAQSRVRRLAAETPASFVAFDLLALGDRDLREAPLAERRARLDEVLADAQPPVYLSPSSTDLTVAADWFGRFEGAGLDGVVAKRLDGPYRSGERTMIKVKHHRTADCVVGGFRIHKDGKGVGSLLLGLYDNEGRLHHVGVASGFTAKYRPQLLEELQPLREHALDDHPWRDWAEFMMDAAAAGTRLPGGDSRWNAGKDLSWEAVRPERVVEVRFGQLQGNRFRHGTAFSRWRPDRSPDSCTYDQLDVAVPLELGIVFVKDGPPDGART